MSLLGRLLSPLAFVRGFLPGGGAGHDPGPDDFENDPARNPPPELQRLKGG